MRQPKFDPSKPCSWCNPCPASFCDCGVCSDPKCVICTTPASEYMTLVQDEKLDNGKKEKAQSED